MEELLKVLKETVDFRMEVLQKKPMPNIAEVFPFYFADPNIVSINKGIFQAAILQFFATYSAMMPFPLESETSAT